MATTANIFIDTRAGKDKKSTCPVKLRVIHLRKSKEYATIHNLTPEDFQKLKAPNVSAYLQMIREDLKTTQASADAIIKRLNPFSYFEFHRDLVEDNPLFKQRKASMPDVPTAPPSEFDFTPYYAKFPILSQDHNEPGAISGVFCCIIRQLISENRLGSAFKYRESYNSLFKFGGNARFKDITVRWLRRYEDNLLKAGRSKTTVGMTLRNLRCVFNEADHLGIINKQHSYPFGRRKYQMPSSRKTNKALSLQDIGRLYYYQPPCESEEYTIGLWFFCYFGNGMNVKDLAQLKYKNIEEEFLKFDRAKTELTARENAKSITVFINEDMQRIIDRWGNPDRDKENYIFPILRPGLSPLEEYRAVPRATQFINSWMKKIGKELGFELKLSTIVTRHSFSTLLKRANVSTEYIQEALGHTDIRTTENYLGSFENGVVKANAGKLTEFKR